jgi:hypothetical protein
VRRPRRGTQEVLIADGGTSDTANAAGAPSHHNLSHAVLRGHHSGPYDSGAVSVHDGDMSSKHGDVSSDAGVAAAEGVAVEQDHRTWLWRWLRFGSVRPAESPVARHTPHGALPV